VNWSYDTLEREVRANLVYRAFTHIGDEVVPDAKTLARLGQAMTELAGERGVVLGRKVRVDTTVDVNVHYLNDCSLLGARPHANHEEGREGYRRADEADS